MAVRSTTQQERPWVEVQPFTLSIIGKSQLSLVDLAILISYLRPSKGSLDQWSDAVDDNSYKWNNFFPFLKKTWAFTPPNYNKIDKKTKIPYDPSAYSPTGGPLQLSFPNYREPFDDPMQKGFANSGFKSIDGFNSGKLNGYGPGTYTINPQDQTRSTSAWGFLRQAIATNTMPPNLKIYIKTLAKKINFDANKKATGVTVETNGAQYLLSARKEVILSAGVFHSPQVLMVSGVGPAATLQGHGIPVVADLQGVGQNMWDHVFMFTSHKTNLTTNSAVLSDPQLHAAAVDKYINQQDGPLTGVGGDVLGFEKLPNRTALSPATLAEFSKYPADFPEVEYLGLAFNSGPANTTSENNYVYVAISLQTVSSRGYVNISSADTNDKPLFNPNLLATQPDQELAVQAVKRARDIAVGSGVQVLESGPGPAVQTDAQILAWIKDHAVVGDHASSTCAMGKQGDPMAVIDSKARVFGVSGLRVVDASSLPFLPPGHPYSSVCEYIPLFH